MNINDIFLISVVYDKHCTLVIQINYSFFSTGKMSTQEQETYKAFCVLLNEGMRLTSKYRSVKDIDLYGKEEYDRGVAMLKEVLTPEKEAMSLAYLQKLSQAPQATMEENSYFMCSSGDQMATSPSGVFSNSTELEEVNLRFPAMNVVNPASLIIVSSVLPCESSIMRKILDSK